MKKAVLRTAFFNFLECCFPSVSVTEKLRHGSDCGKDVMRTLWTKKTNIDYNYLIFCWLKIRNVFSGIEIGPNLLIIPEIIVMK